MKSYIIIYGLIFCFLTGFSQAKGTFKDPRDGKIYKTVKIDSQTWMAENLAYKAISGSRAFNNDEKNVPKYGRLYVWNTANSVCPTGWHLPDYEEWKKLVDSLGGGPVAGGKMKAVTLWNSPNVAATNSSGFSALPGGAVDGKGVFTGVVFPNQTGSLGSIAYFWTATPSENGKAWLCFLGNFNGTIYLEEYSYDTGCSVRCKKD